MWCTLNRYNLYFSIKYFKVKTKQSEQERDDCQMHFLYLKILIVRITYDVYIINNVQSSTQNTFGTSSN